MLGQDKKMAAPTTRGTRVSFFFLTNKIQKVYAVGCQDLANGKLKLKLETGEHRDR